MKTKFSLSIFVLLSTLSLSGQTPLDTIVLITGSKHAVILLEENEDEIVFLDDWVRRTLPANGVKEIIKNDKINIAFSVDHDKKEVYLHHVVNIPGKSKEQIHIMAKEWMIQTFRDENDLIQLDNKDIGKLIGNGTALVNTGLDELSTADNFMHFIVKIDSKDEKARIKIEKLIVTRNGDTPAEAYFWSGKGKIRTGFKDLREEIEQESLNVAKNFVVFMQRYDNSEDDDW